MSMEFVWYRLGRLLSDNLKRSGFLGTIRLSFLREIYYGELCRERLCMRDRVAFKINFSLLDVKIVELV